MAPTSRPKQRNNDRRNPRQSRNNKRRVPSKSKSHSNSLSADALAKLDRLNQQNSLQAPDITTKKAVRRTPSNISDINREIYRSKNHYKRNKRRVVSGELLEEGKSPKLRGGGGYEDGSNGYNWKKICIILCVVNLIILLTSS